MAEEKKPEVHEDFDLMDRQDEEQILDELRGVPVDKFIYKNARGQYELSYAGTKWAVRKFAEKGEAIRIVDHPKVERCPLEPTEHIVVTVLARRVVVDKESGRETSLDSNVGASRGWTKQALNDGRIVEDSHFFSKTVSKATRNVQQMLLPQDFKKELVDSLVKQQGGAPPAARGATAKKPQQAAQAPAAAPAQAGKPAGAAPAQGAPQQATQAAPKSAAAPAAAPATTQPANKAAAPAATPPAKPPPAGAAKKADRDSLVQRFNVVLRQAVGAKDDKAAWRWLPILTEFSSPNDVPTEAINILGPILNMVVKKTARIENDTIKDMKSGAVLWPAPVPAAAAPKAAPAAAAPAPEPPPAQDESPSSDEPPAPTEEPMF